MTKTIVETSYGYNVQIMLPSGHVIANASDTVRSVAERYAELQARDAGYNTENIKKQFITLV